MRSRLADPRGIPMRLEAAAAAAYPDGAVTAKDLREEAKQGTLKTWMLDGAIVTTVPAIRNMEALCAHQKLTRIQASRVYFLYSAGHVKIGFSEDSRIRIANLAGCSPLPATLILQFGGTRVTERELHDRFHQDRGNGEWFRLSPTLRAYFDEQLGNLVGGRARLANAEAQFRRWLAGQSA